VRANTALASDDTIVVDGIALHASGGPARRVRFTVLELP
jgi:hypothetical protein